MAIIAFWSNEMKETAKTLSMSAIATHMAMYHNYKILMISTIRNDDTLETCFWEPHKDQPLKDITGNKKDITSGIDGLVNLAVSHKLTPESVSNYTKLVFPGNRLEILLGSTDEDHAIYEEVRETYKEVIETANQYYDYVFVDLNKGLKEGYIKNILEVSDLIVVCLKQGLKYINDFKIARNENEFLQKDNILILSGNNDQDSKYNEKNIARALGYKQDIALIPHNTLFFEECTEGKIVDYFLRFAKINQTDKNARFIENVKESEELIVERIKMLKSRY